MCLKFVRSVENNTFLFPKSWSETIDMTDYTWSYRTYHSGSIGNSRYHNIEIYVLGKKLLEILFRGDKIEFSQDLSEK